MRQALNIALVLVSGLWLAACNTRSTGPNDPPSHSNFLHCHASGTFPRGGGRVVQVGHWGYTVNDRVLMTLDLSQPGIPRIVDKLTTNRFVYGLTADSSSIYLSTEAGLDIYDVSASGRPQFSGNCFVRYGEPFKMIIRGSRLFWLNISELGILDISNAAQVTQLGSVGRFGGLLSDFVVVDNYAFLWSVGGLYLGPGGLRVVDISDHHNPSLAASITGPGCGFRASLQSIGEYLYVTCSAGTKIYDISTPANPTLVSTLAEPASRDCPMLVSGNHLFAPSRSMIHVYDVTEPTAPILRSSTPLPFDPDCISISDTRLVSSNYDSLAVFSLADPAAPAPLSALELRHANGLCGGDSIGMLADGSLGLLLVTRSWTAQAHSPTRGEAKDVAIDGSNYVYVADGDSGLTILRAGYLSTLAGHLNLPGNCCAVGLAGGRCLVGTTDGRLHVVDVNNRTAPAMLGSVGLSGPIADIAVVDSLAVIACGPGGLQIVNIAHPPALTVLYSLTGTAPIYHALATGTRAFYIEQGNGLIAVDIADPVHPAASQQIVRGDGLFTEDDGDMALYGRYVIAAAANHAYLIDSSNPSAGVLSQYSGARHCRALAVLSNERTLTILGEGGFFRYTITLPTE